MIKKVFFIAALALFVSSCAVNRAVIRQDYNFAAIKTVRVGKFASETVYDNSGNVVQNAFMKNLMAKGYRVIIDPSVQADVVIEGSLTVYQPDKRYLVYTPDVKRMGRHNRRAPMIYTSDVIEISGSNMYDLGTAFGLGENNRIMASNATVGIYAYMTDNQTGEVVWSDSYTYEGLDLTSALDGAVKYILRSIPKENINVGGN